MCLTMVLASYRANDRLALLVRLQSLLQRRHNIDLNICTATKEFEARLDFARDGTDVIINAKIGELESHATA